MTNEEILTYFAGHTVYLWDGTMDELHDAQVESNSSYNTIVSNYKIYFISHGVVSDARATVVSI
jgi:hypothetical protein